MRPDLGIDPVAIDVSRLVERSVASLYSHLVTRPTGRAVRMAIESQLVEGTGLALSLIDFSEVRVLDFSCADEVVAKLILHFMEARESRQAFFVFQGVGEQHRDPIEAVLDRHDLATVAETGPQRFELLGRRSDREMRVWSIVEDRGLILADEVEELLSDPLDRAALIDLAARRLLFHRPREGDFRALSTLVKDLL